MSRRLTTGKFKTREELVDRVSHFHHNTNLKVSEIARLCGVAPGTVNTLIRQSPRPASKAKEKSAPTREGSRDTILGLWCWCYQETGLARTPFKGQIIADHGSYWTLKVGQQTLKVNRGACSTTPFKK